MSAYKQQRQQGFAVLTGIIIIVVLIALAGGGWYLWRNRHKSINVTSSNQTTGNSSQTTQNNTTDPYQGWSASTSSRAGFTFKYPTNWSYASSVGSKDNVEHITITSEHFIINMDSFSGQDVANGGQPNRTCSDCLQTINSDSINISKIGPVDLKLITYKLDNGQGNAIVLQQPDGTYYISSPSHAGIKTSFRGISVLPTEQAYQAESPDQLKNNPDYETAKKILESIAY